MGVQFDRLGDELTARLPYDDKLIGNPLVPALHGGATGAFMEIAAVVQLSWGMVWSRWEAGGDSAARIAAGDFPPMPKTIDFSIDYLRSADRATPTLAASVSKRGRRVANVRVERGRMSVSARSPRACHFMMPDLT